MAAAGQYLDEKPVNAVVIVLTATQPRVDPILARLIQIVVGKVHPKDYDKILVAVNRYSHSQYNRDHRAGNHDAEWQRTEEENQAWIKKEVVKSFASESCLSSWQLSAVVVGQHVLLLLLTGAWPCI